MLEVCQDLWSQFGQPNHRVGISVNGYVKRNGRAVMGRGCAKQATEFFPNIDLSFGSYLKIKGNVPGYLWIDKESGLISVPEGERLMILPVKHNWWEQASIDLVRRSVAFLVEEAEDHPDVTFHVPRLGCGNGRLSWNEEVGPWMRKVLPENVWVHH